VEEHKDASMQEGVKSDLASKAADLQLAAATKAQSQLQLELQQANVDESRTVISHCHFLPL
jgi:hypothetical protein